MIENKESSFIVKGFFVRTIFFHRTISFTLFQRIGVFFFHSSLDMHDAAHTMMISDIATSAWLIDFCHKAI